MIKKCEYIVSIRHFQTGLGKPEDYQAASMARGVESAPGAGEAGPQHSGAHLELFRAAEAADLVSRGRRAFSSALSARSSL